MMKSKIYFWIAGFLVLGVLPYLAGSFVAWDFNPAHWSAWARVGYFIILVVAPVIIRKAQTEVFTKPEPPREQKKVYIKAKNLPERVNKVPLIDIRQKFNLANETKAFAYLGSVEAIEIVQNVFAFPGEKDTAYERNELMNIEEAQYAIFEHMGGILMDRMRLAESIEKAFNVYRKPYNINNQYVVAWPLKVQSKFFESAHDHTLDENAVNLAAMDLVKCYEIATEENLDELYKDRKQFPFVTLHRLTDSVNSIMHRDYPLHIIAAACNVAWPMQLQVKRTPYSTLIQQGYQVQLRKELD